MKASVLPDRYEIGKTQFYQRRNYLLELGYALEPNKEGRTSFYSDEQVQLLDELDAYIKARGGLEGFPPAVIETEISGEEANRNGTVLNNGNGLVRANSEPVHIESAEAEEIYVNTNPLEDIREQNLRSVDVAAQYAAAQNLVAFNYLQVDYMKRRDFSVAGLAEEVHQSEQTVRQTFASMMESPSQTTKKLMARLKERRS